MKTHSRQSRHQYGFSLIEILVAFAIMSLSLGVLAQIYSRGTYSLGLGDSSNQVVMLAESLLTSAAYEGTDESLPQGQFQDMDWRVETRPYLPNGEGSSSGQVMKLQTVRVTVRWQERGHEREFVLSSLRPVPAP